MFFLRIFCLKTQTMLLCICAFYVQWSVLFGPRCPNVVNNYQLHLLQLYCFYCK